METPIMKYDHLSPKLAVVAAWTIKGNNPLWHERMQDEVHKMMPLLARALDRLASES